MKLDLVGPSNALASSFVDCTRTYDFCLEQGGGKGPYLRKRPCLTPFVTAAGDGAIRGVFAITTDSGHAYGVAGSRVVEFDSSGSILFDFGAVEDDGLPVSWASNGTAGNQILIISGGFGYILDLLTNTLGSALGGDFPADALQCEFMDGYFIVTIHNTRRFQISGLEDGTAWDALDVAERSEAADNIRSMIRSHRELWFRGDLTSEVWYDNGDPDFPFAPIQGVFVENGATAPFAAVRVDNTTMWVDRDERGEGIVRKMNGYDPVRVSTFAVEHALAASHFGRLDFAQMFAFQLAGHTFVVLYVDDLPTSWVYDVAENAWFQWSHYDSTACVRVPWVATTACYQFNTVLLGDRRTDTIYRCSFDLLTDDLTTP